MTPPSRTLPSRESEHYALYVGVRDAIASLPNHFVSTTLISGILATDLHTLNTVLGATIEDQVVKTLNRLRNVWDPNQKYESYYFIRQAQTFPDVLLRNSTNVTDILLGIELKGWYLLAKEGEPSLRFQSTAAACAERDLVVVVPWVLEHVVSGSPVVFDPFIESARYAAEYRNYHWTSVRKTNQDVGIAVPSSISPYPSKADQILDKPASDRGGNFGRLARTGLMDNYIRALDNVMLCGIEAIYWREFLGIFRENTSSKEARSALQKLKKRLKTVGVPSLQHQSVPSFEGGQDRKRAAVVVDSALAISEVLDHLIGDMEFETDSEDETEP